MVQTSLVKGLRGEQYNFKNKTHIPENRYEHIQITPQTYVQRPFLQGSFMEWKIQNVDQCLMSQFYLHLRIRNADLVNALSLDNIPQLIDSMSLMAAGTEISSKT